MLERPRIGNLCLRINQSQGMNTSLRTPRQMRVSDQRKSKTHDTTAFPIMSIHKMLLIARLEDLALGHLLCSRGLISCSTLVRYVPSQDKGNGPTVLSEGLRSNLCREHVRSSRVGPVESHSSPASLRSAEASSRFLSTWLYAACLSPPIST